MGLFISHCKECNEELHWFLKCDNGITCKKCGTHNSEKEVRDSWLNYYKNTQEEIKFNKLNNSSIPWSDEVIKDLEVRQANQMMHPYTCDRRSPECEVNMKPRDYSKDGVLIPTKDGWVCPCGKYKQNWY